MCVLTLGELNKLFNINCCIYLPKFFLNKWTVSKFISKINFGLSFVDTWVTQVVLEYLPLRRVCICVFLHGRTDYAHKNIEIWWWRSPWLSGEEQWRWHLVSTCDLVLFVGLAWVDPELTRMKPPRPLLEIPACPDLAGTLSSCLSWPLFDWLVLSWSPTVVFKTHLHFLPRLVSPAPTNRLL